jgi:ABC-type branched-subunit amino acid transport system permease subunit
MERIIHKCEVAYASVSTEVLAFLPLAFLGRGAFGSLWAAWRADTRAMAAVRRSGLYPRRAKLEAIPMARRPPDRGRIVES